MATLTLKNVPDALHRRLKAQAERNHRSLNREAIRLLEDAVATAAVQDEAGERARALREKLSREGVSISPEEVFAAIDEGRP